jgi:hypothetical protein
LDEIQRAGLVCEIELTDFISLTPTVEMPIIQAVLRSMGVAAVARPLPYRRNLTSLSVLARTAARRVGAFGNG